MNRIRSTKASNNPKTKKNHHKNKPKPQKSTLTAKKRTLTTIPTHNITFPRQISLVLSNSTVKLPKNTQDGPKNIRKTQKRSFFGSVLNAFRPAAKSAFDDLPPIDADAALRSVKERERQQYYEQSSTQGKGNDPNNDKNSALNAISPSNHQHSDACKHPHTHNKSPSFQPGPGLRENTQNGPNRIKNGPNAQNNIQNTQNQKYRKITPTESDLAMILCNIKHPDSNLDLIQGEFVTQIKETSPGHVIVRLKLDKNFRSLKTQIESLISRHYNIPSLNAVHQNEANDDSSVSSQGDSKGQSSSHSKSLKSLRISLADTQDDPDSLNPVKAPPTITPAAPGSKLKMTSAGGKQQSLNTEGQTTGSGARGLSNVKKVILVYSGKGGVGKSSVAVNLAAAMTHLDADGDDGDEKIASQIKNGMKRKMKIGIFDADIFGPSLPSLIDAVSLSQGIIGADGLDIAPNATSETIDLVEDYQDDTSALIRPISANNMKLMSYGYVTRTKGSHGGGPSGPAPAIMRGGMVGPYLTELLTRTNWGDLDALIVDMPPGTSDVHITLTQQVKNASAVVVTTPSRLAYVDVVRGMQLLDQTNIPIVSLVQNMSYFIAPNDPNRTKHYIFGGGDDENKRKKKGGAFNSQTVASQEQQSGNNRQNSLNGQNDGQNDETISYKQKLITLGSIPTSVEMPIIPEIAYDAEEGLPMTMKYNNAIKSVIEAIAKGKKDENSLQEIVDNFQKSQQNQKNNSQKDGLDEGTKNTLINYALLAHNVHHWSSPLNRSMISRPDMNMEYDKVAHKLVIKSNSDLSGQLFTPKSHKNGQNGPKTDQNAPNDQKDQNDQKSLPPPLSSFSLDPRLVRQSCICAACKHEFTGTQLQDPNKVAMDIVPTTIQSRGAYAVAIQWSDGHSGSIYTWDQLLGIANRVNSGAM